MIVAALPKLSDTLTLPQSGGGADYAQQLALPNLGNLGPWVTLFHPWEGRLPLAHSNFLTSWHPL